MRIRKRQPVVLLETPPPSSHLARPLSAFTHEGPGQFVGQHGCLSRGHQHPLISKEAAKPQDASPVWNPGDTSYLKRSQVADEEAYSVDYARPEAVLPSKEKTGSQAGKSSSDDVHKLEVKRDGTQSRPYEFVEFVEEAGRVRGSQETYRSAIERTDIQRGDRAPSVERDLNHPSNKPKESLLYSLYSVFSRLSGKTVLTAREALSRIIEEGLPGLDEEVGLPSVQVAKVMRSNPYFVHLEGGKFLLCSGPSHQNNDQLISGLDLADAVIDPAISQQPAATANGVGKGDRDEEQHDYTGLRNKRARSKSSSSNEMRDKNDSSLISEEIPKLSASKSQLSVSPKITPPDHVAVQICKRYDGRGWKCHQKALEGYSMCRHHHELIVNRLARLRNSGRLGSKKLSKRRKPSGKQLSESSAVTDGDLKNEQSGAQWRKNVKARSLKSINT
ncbi:hypothetical protein MPTK1_5g23980 [Marchantia polymorpha subsp. ruderalis]|uniref:WRC domain-containing protein n=1 Tax=Marchantia polymorpha subsp. ruderalis TaxID=1480154 RepID=A0A176WB32_MARPO|nr:hypothetical protein AXG93_3612s1310 [Marchantia polymorpha subsp. ruderalis]BBN12919.1 hypothetical protein Mp_5g23980 [Marchantia polymorpha subsp. ruderalis]